MINGTDKAEKTTGENSFILEPKPIYPFPMIDSYEVKMGEEYGLVTIIQIMLDVLRLYYDTFGAVPIGGFYDTATENAVKEFQRINGIPQTGKVDMLTWNRLAEEYNSALYENQ